MFDLSCRCTSMLLHRYSAISRVSRLNNERPSFASRFIIEKPLSAIHVSLKTRQTRRSTRSLPLLQDCISNYIIELRIPGEWFQTLVTNGISNYVTSTLFVANSTAHWDRRNDLARRKSKLLEIKSIFFLFFYLCSLLSWFSLWLKFTI